MLIRTEHFHRAPSLRRGEWGIERPSQMISFVSTSMTSPPAARRSRQPSATFDADTIVTYRGLPLLHRHAIEMAPILRCECDLHVAGLTTLEEPSTIPTCVIGVCRAKGLTP